MKSSALDGLDAKNENARRWILAEDGVLAGAAATTIGPDGLKALAAEFSDMGKRVLIAKV